MTSPGGLLAVLVSACLLVAAPVVPQDTGSTAPALAPAAAAADQRPSIVLVLMDDFSTELLPTMSQAREMQREGASFDYSFVVDSLCCVSRAATATGRYPHQTKVLINTPNGERPLGGWDAFKSYAKNRGRSVNVRLQDSGYTTGFIGKYLNGYQAALKGEGPDEHRELPPGWDSWQAYVSGAYDEWGFETTELGAGGLLTLRSFPASDRDRDYATNVIADDAVDFITSHREDAKPYFLQVSTFAPHSTVSSRAHQDDPRFPPAFADRPSAADPDGNCGGTPGKVDCARMYATEMPGYNDERTDNRPVRDNGRAIAWQRKTALLDGTANSHFRNRARMVQAIDRLLARVREAAGDDAYIVLTSDNGFHLGQHGLALGKGAPYDTDTRVPLVVTGPGVTPGARDQVVSNIDLAPTFERIAGLRPDPAVRSGESMLHLLRAPRAQGNTYAFFEHTFAESSRSPGGAARRGGGEDDPDADGGFGGTTDEIPSYIAVRSRQALFVRWDLDNDLKTHRYAYELYRYTKAAYDERTNLYAGRPTHPWVERLRSRLEAFDGCKPKECRRLRS